MLNFMGEERERDFKMFRLKYFFPLRLFFFFFFRTNIKLLCERRFKESNGENNNFAASLSFIVELVENKIVGVFKFSA